MNEVTAVIEISEGNLDGIKYEIDPLNGTLQVDRLLTSDIPYPANYGFIPNTLAPDHDCTDVLVVFPVPIQPTAHIRVRIIGALDMTDEHGSDVKIVAVPVDEVTELYNDVKEVEDLSLVTGSTVDIKQSIQYFFENYKKKEAHRGKWAKIHGWFDAETAKGLVRDHTITFIG